MRVAAAVAVLLATSSVAYADEPRAAWRTDDQPHAGVPFDLELIVEGFDEQPQPAIPALTIPGATVRALGAEPNVSRSIQIINGRRSDDTHVQWALHWNVTLAKAGKLRVPATTVTQGSKHATAPGAEADVEDIPVTDAMKLELSLPDRPVFVGENIPITLTWLFRTDRPNPTFQVPMLDGDSFTIGTVPATNQKTFKFQGGDKTLDLPYTIDDSDVGGVPYHRLRATFYAAPRKTGKIDVGAATVVCALPVGRPDFFGSAQMRLFRASDTTRTLEVKPLPETDRPPGFEGAVGTQFSIAVATSRSVVQLGEPVELAVTVKSDQRLDTLSLGRLDGPGGLPKDRFAVPADVPTGELSDDGKTKTFKITAQVTGPATEVPSLALAYFDPVKGAYEVVHSDPIALSVKGGAVVGANDVVAASPARPAAAAQPAGDADLALVGADLALSAPGDTDSRPLGGALLWLLVALLYAVPLALFAGRSWQLRTRARREDAAEVRAANKRVEHELARAQKDPARDTAGPLAAALRELARALERSRADDGGLL
ncbi:MAG TPA: BatD family protein, partial [Kofleriaceae bacterium]